MVTKQAVAKFRHDGRKETSSYRVRNSAQGSIIPVRTGNGTNELWCTIPSHLQPQNTRNIHTYLWYYMYFREKGKRAGKRKKTHTTREMYHTGIVPVAWFWLCRRLWLLWLPVTVWFTAPFCNLPPVKFWIKTLEIRVHLVIVFCRQSQKRGGVRKPAWSGSGGERVWRRFPDPSAVGTSVTGSLVDGNAMIL